MDVADESTCTYLRCVPRTARHLRQHSRPALEEEASRSRAPPSLRSRRPAGWGCGEQAMDGLRPDLETGCRQEGAAPPARRAATPAEARHRHDQKATPDLRTGCRQEGASPPARREATPTEVDPKGPGSPDRKSVV